MAALSSLIVNITRTLYPKKGQEPEMTSATDFMPGWELTPEQRKQRGKKEQSVEQMKRMLYAIAGKQGTRESIPKRKRVNKKKKEK